MVQLQDSISKYLHHHTFSSMLSNKISEAHCAQILSCFGPGVNVWLIAQLVFPVFRLPSLVFSITLCTRLGLPHPSITNIPRCVCTHPIDLMGIDFLCCAHGNERTKTHDVIHDTFVAITRDVSFHVGREQLHVFRSITFNSFRQQIDIVLTKYNICTVVDIVIVNPTRTDLFLRSCVIQRFVTLMQLKPKKKNYHNQYSIDQFLPLTIEIFGCLHKYADVFLHNCANVIWNLKGPRGPHLSTLVIFFHQKVLITLQRMQTFSILSRTVAISLLTSRFPPL